MANFIGSWKFKSAENIEAYFAKIGVPEKDIKEINDLYDEKRECRDEFIALPGGKYRMIATSDDKVIKTGTFASGEKHRDTTWDDRMLDIQIDVVNDNKIIEKESGPYEATITNEVKGNNLIVTMTSGGVTAVLRYIRF